MCIFWSLMWTLLFWLVRNQRLNGSMFGHPMNREREYRITYNASKTWTCQYTFAELSQILLHHSKKKLPLNADCYSIATAKDLKKAFQSSKPGEELLSRICMYVQLVIRFTVRIACLCVYLCVNRIKTWSVFYHLPFMFLNTCSFCVDFHVCKQVYVRMDLCTYVTTHVWRT